MTRISETSSSAKDRQLSNWYQRIHTGQIRLPRFQRFQAWDRLRICDFLTTIVSNLPVGITLLLEVGDRELFESRALETAPDGGSRVTEHLLDGQQRPTTLWRSMHNNYDRESFCLYLPDLVMRPVM